MAFSTSNDLRTKYRPKKFAEIVGQEEVVAAMKGYSTGAVSLSHALIFEGDRGVGKTTSARILAAALNCRNKKPGEAEPCGECPECRSALSGTGELPVSEEINCSDFNVQDARNFIENFRIRTSAKWRVAILDEAQQLKQAASEFLKPIEEPDNNVLYIFCTTDAHKLPPALISRLKRHHMRNVGHRKLADYIQEIAGKEEIEVASEDVDRIVGGAGGSVRMALSRLEEFRDDLPLTDTSIVTSIAEMLIDNDLPGALYNIKLADNSGALNPREALEELHSFYGDALACRYNPDLSEILLKDKAQNYVDLVKEAADNEEIEQSELLRGVSVMASSLQNSGFVSSTAQLEAAVVQALDPEEERIMRRIVDVMEEAMDESNGKIVLKVTNKTIVKNGTIKQAESDWPGIDSESVAVEESAVKKSEKKSKREPVEEPVEEIEEEPVEPEVDEEKMIDELEANDDQDDDFQDVPEDEEEELEEDLDNEEPEDEVDDEVDEVPEEEDDDEETDPEDIESVSEELAERLIESEYLKKYKRVQAVLEDLEVFPDDEEENQIVLSVTRSISEKMENLLCDHAEEILEELGATDFEPVMSFDY